MTADKLITASIMFMVALCLILFAAVSSVLAMPVEGASSCNPHGYTGGEGDWIIDPADNECWYLHSIPEFDGGYYNCIACHDGTQASEW